VLTFSSLQFTSDITVYSMAVGGPRTGSSPVDSASRFLEAVPFLLAATYYMFGPFFISQVRQKLVDHLKKVGDEWKGPQDSPPHLTPRAIAVTAEWTIDAPQVVPTLLLPLAGAVFALRSSSISAAVLAFAALVISVFCLWIYAQSPLEYRAHRYIFHRYTILSMLGIILNLVIVIVLVTL